MACIIFFVTFNVSKGKVLIITNTETNKEWVLKVPEGNFTFSYVHSVHRTPVDEIFTVSDDNKLIMEEVRFQSLGVGMPFTNEGGTFSIEDGKFILKFNREFTELHFRVSSIPQHNIKIGDKIYPLLIFTEPEQQIRIHADEKWYIARD